MGEEARQGFQGASLLVVGVGGLPFRELGHAPGGWWAGRQSDVAGSELPEGFAQRVAPLIAAGARAVGVETGIGSAAAGARRMTGSSLTPGPSADASRSATSQAAVISAQTNPASSLAMAVTTVVRLVFLASRRWNVPHRRVSADSRSSVRRWVVPAWVIPPRWVRSPEECSEGTRPQNLMNIEAP
jgi:hypothetical protein